MLYLLGIFVIVMVLGTLLLQATVRIMGQKAGTFIHTTHQDIESIIATRSAPPQWTEPFVKRMMRLSPDDPDRQTRIVQITRSARQTCISKLDKLTKYIQNSSLVENEQTRLILLNDLTEIRKEWGEQDWGDVVSNYRKAQ